MSGVKVPKETIDGLMKAAEYHITHEVFRKLCVVVAKLPNGFTVVGEAACVDPANYDAVIGEKLAKQRIEEKLWELEGYRLQCQLHDLHELENDDSLDALYGDDADFID